jgi:hypothetical protein
MSRHKLVKEDHLCVDSQISPVESVNLIEKWCSFAFFCDTCNIYIFFYHLKNNIQNHQYVIYLVFWGTISMEKLWQNTLTCVAELPQDSHLSWTRFWMHQVRDKTRWIIFISLLHVLGCTSQLAPATMCNSFHQILYWILILMLTELTWLAVKMGMKIARKKWIFLS